MKEVWRTWCSNLVLVFCAGVFFLYPGSLHAFNFAPVAGFACTHLGFVADLFSLCDFETPLPLEGSQLSEEGIQVVEKGGHDMAAGTWAVFPMGEVLGETDERTQDESPLTGTGVDVDIVEFLESFSVTYANALWRLGTPQQTLRTTTKEGRDIYLGATTASTDFATELNTIRTLIDKQSERDGDTRLDGLDDLRVNADLTNLTITGTLTDTNESTGLAGYILQSTGSGVSWVATSSLGFSAATTLAALTDTTTGSAASGHVLVYNGTSWVSQATSTLGFNVSGADLSLTNGYVFRGGAGNTAEATSSLFIADDGKVGVGTTTPSDVLTVEGDLRLTGGIDFRASTRITSDVGGALYQVTGSVTQPIYSGIGGVYKSVLNQNGLAINNGSTGAGSGVGLLVASGNVGIGTTTPSSLLNVSQDQTSMISGNPLVLIESTGAQISTKGELLWLQSHRGSATPDVSLFKVSNASGDLLAVRNDGNVGIGTTTPSGRLHVNGGDMYFGDDSDTPRLLRFMRGGSQTGAVGTTNSLLSLIGGPGGTPHLVINASGNVGIGTTSPAATLDILSSTGAIRARSSAVDNFNKSLRLLTGSYDTAEEDVKIIGGDITSSNSYVDIGGSSSAYNAATQIRFWTDAQNTLIGTQRMVITATGNVGIGTTSPQYRLDVDGTSADAIANFRNTQSSDGNIGYIIAGPANGTGAIIGQAGYTVDANEYTFVGNIGDDVSGGTGIVIKRGGNIGVGTTSPASKLDVWGDLRIGTSSTPALFTDVSTGRVGIGTAGPTYLLDITSSNDTALQRWASLGQSLQLAYDSSDNAFDFTSSAGRHVTFNNGGNVGIGNTDPSEMLEVGGAAGESRIQVSASSDTVQTELLSNSSTYGGMGGVGTRTADPFTLRTNNVDRVFIDTSGNVGIGTTTPDRKLVVFDTAASVNVLAQTALSTGFGALQAKSDDLSGLDVIMHGTARTPFRYGINVASWGEIGLFDNGGTGAGLMIGTTDLDAPIVFGTQNVERMRIAGSGNVGIGTTTPSNPLHIYTSGSSGIRQESTGNFITTSLVTNQQQWNLTNAVDRTFKIVNSTDSLTALTIDTSSNIGIGTTSPAALLHVANGSSGFTGSYNVRTQAVVESDNSNGTTLSIMSPSSGYSGIFFGDQTVETQGQLKFNHTSNSFGFTTTASTEQLVLLNNGNVGIGTTTPATRLSVYAAGNYAAAFNGVTDGAVILGSLSGVPMIQGMVNGAAAATANLALQPSGGSVGIGTTTPDGTLHVHTATAGLVTANTAINEIVAESGSDGGISILTPAANVGRIAFGDPSDNDVGRIDYDHTADFFAFRTAGSEKLRITSAGNVGISTTSPWKTLSVEGDLSVTGAVYDSTNTAGTNGYILQTTGAGTQWVATSSLGFVTTADFDTSAELAAILSNETGSGAAVFGTSPTLTTLTLSGTTTLGINDKIKGTSNSQFIQVQTNDGDINFSSVGDVTMNIDSDNNGTGHSFSLLNNSTNETGSLLFRIQESGNAYVAGNVGIGTTSPLGALDIYRNGSAPTVNIVSANNGFDPALQLVGNSAISTEGFRMWYDNDGADTYFDSVYDNDNGDILFRTKAGGTAINALTIKGSGNVGIGTTSPAYVLHLADTAGGTMVNVEHTDGPTASIRITGDGGYSEIIQSNDHTAFNNSTGEKVRITSSGNVGIGTTTPTTGAKLDVYGYISSGQYLDLGRSTRSNGHLRLWSTAGTLTGGLQNAGSGETNLYATGGGAFLTLSAGGSERMRVTDAGNVGIGTTSPASKLDVWGDLRIGTSSLPNLFVNTTNSRVSIGTVNADATLHVAGNSKFTNNMYLTTNDTGIWFNDVGSYLTGIKEDTGGNLDFRVNSGTERMTIDTSGNVGIGTTSPNSKLAVAADGTSYSGAQLTLQGATNPLNRLHLGYDTTANVGQIQAITDGVAFRNLALNASGGNVGIGTVTPDTELDIESSDTGYTGVEITNTDGSTRRWAVLTNSNSTTYGPAKGFGIRDISGARTPFVIDISGNVGIGTTTPNATLAVHGDINISNSAYGYGIGNNRVLYASSTNFSTILGIDAGTLLGATGINNTAVGYQALNAVTTADYNTGVGYQAGYNSTAGYMTLVGNSAGYQNSGTDLTAFGHYAGNDNSGAYVTALGVYAGQNNSGDDSTFVGWFAGLNNTADHVVAVGSETLRYTDATNTVAVGYQAGRGVDRGSSQNSVFLGYRAGFGITSGDNNILLGYQAGDALTSGANNIAIGYDVDLPSNTASNQLNIGNTIYGDLSSGFIGIGSTSPSTALSVNGTTTITNLIGAPTTLSTDANGRIIRTPSDANLKTNIATIDNALEKVLGLRGVTFEWKDQSRFGSVTEVGFIAQEVDLILPEAVRKGGDYWSLNTPNIVAVVIEAIKEMWAKVTDNSDRLDLLEAENELLKARLDALEGKDDSTGEILDPETSSGRPQGSVQDDTTVVRAESGTKITHGSTTITDNSSNNTSTATTSTNTANVETNINDTEILLDNTGTTEEETEEEIIEEVLDIVIDEVELDSEVAEQIDGEIDLVEEVGVEETEVIESTMVVE